MTNTKQGPVSLQVAVLIVLLHVPLAAPLVFPKERLGFMRSVAPSARWLDCPATDPVQSDLSYVERFARMIQNKTSTETVKGFARVGKNHAWEPVHRRYGLVRMALFA